MSAEDAALEAELRSQLQEQIHGLAEVEEALQASPDDPDLLELKSQLEQGIVQFRDSLHDVQQHLILQQQHQTDQHLEQQEQEQQEQQQDPVRWDQHLFQEQQAEQHVRPRWLLPGVHCCFRYSDGLWHPGVVHEWQPQLQLPVTVHFAYPTRQYMLQEVQLPLGLVQPAAGTAAGAAGGGDSSSSITSTLSVGSRVLVQPPSSWLWQPAEVTAVLQPADTQHQQQQRHAQPAAASKPHHTGGSSSSSTHRYTVQLVGQQRILTLPCESVIPVQHAAPLSDDQLESGAGAVAAATAAAFGNAAAGPSAAAAAAAVAGGDGGSSGSDMSFSSGDGGSSGASSDDEASSSSSEGGGGVRRLGGRGESQVDVLDHARLAVEAGVQSESITFAAWENSGRGIASKLMARMGFKRGAGLGRRGAGIKDPLDITVLPSKRGLGAAAKHKTHKAAGTGAHSSKHHGKVSGRKRKRMKAAAERHAARADDKQRHSRMEAATGEQGLFAFINDSLGHGSEAAAKLQAAGVYGPDEGGRAAGSKQRQATAGGAALQAAAAAAAAAGSSGAGPDGSRAGQQRQQQQQPDRKGLVGSADDLSALKAQVSHLTAMLERNKANKGLAPQIQARLAQARQAYEAAAAQHKQLHKSVAAKEATKKWMKF